MGVRVFPQIDVWAVWSKSPTATGAGVAIRSLSCTDEGCYRLVSWRGSAQEIARSSIKVISRVCAGPRL